MIHCDGSHFTLLRPDMATSPINQGCEEYSYTCPIGCLANLLTEAGRAGLVVNHLVGNSNGGEDLVEDLSISALIGNLV